MNIFLARQAILDRRLETVGYEILFHLNPEMPIENWDEDETGRRLTQESLLEVGMASVFQDQKAFLRVTRSRLQEGIAAHWPPAQTVLEIQPSVRLDPVVSGLLVGLKAQGYLLALDHFADWSFAEPFLPLADFVKVDLLATPLEECARRVRSLEGTPSRLIATHVETQKELKDAVGLGFTHYQGYFFAKPDLVRAREVAAYKPVYLRLLDEVNRPGAEFDELEQILRRDMPLCVKLLRYVNSAMFGLASRVESIRQALVLLGLDAVKRWASLLALTALADDKPQELLVLSLVRAKFCEILWPGARGLSSQPDPFLIGMLSLMDAVLDRPMEELVRSLPLSDQAVSVLLGSPGGMGRVLHLLAAYERGDWKQARILGQELRQSPEAVTEAYRQSVSWADRVFQTELECRGTAPV